MSSVYKLKKSGKKGKRFLISMPDFGHKHHFGSKGGKTYIDGRTKEERKAWHERHKGDEGYDNRHAGIYYARHLLWGKHSSLDKNIRDLEKKDGVVIKKRF